MPAPKTTPKTPKTKTTALKRPRIDAVLRHIEAGSYDDEIDRILAAVEKRREDRQQAVLKMVKQVYGEDFDVARNSQPLTFNQPTTHRPNPFMAGPEMHLTDSGTSTTEEWIEAEKRAKAEEEALRAEGLTDDDVSNSPIIGSIDASAPAEDQQT